MISVCERAPMSLLRTSSCAALFGDVLRSMERIWRALANPLGDSYRPEKHYMRGPGPKYRAKWRGVDGKHIGQA
jgi:hypothetical protein